MIHNNIKLIIFDWDGTLMNSVSVITDCLVKAYFEVKKEELDRNSAKSVIGLGLNDAMRIICPNATENEVKKLISSYRELFIKNADTHLALFSGAHELVKDLKTNNIKIAIATGKSRLGLERDFIRVNMNNIFDITKTIDESLPKPHPQMINDITKELNISTENTIMVGDTGHDMKMALNAGVKKIAVTYGAHSSSELEKHNPELTFHTINELSEWFNEIFPLSSNQS